MNYADILAQYGADNVKQLGDRIIVIDRRNRWAIGYTIATWNGYAPDGLRDKTYTAIANIPDASGAGITWNGVYDYLFGAPDAPNFTKAINL